MACHVRGKGIDALLFQFSIFQTSFRYEKILLDWELNLGLSRNGREQVPLCHRANSSM